jgi:trehalose 6-phosphate phosphatase
LEGLFDNLVDGVNSERLGIPGKPAPDIFQYAARQLDVDPQEAIVVEDAISGVEAARAGGFGLVVGVARNGDEALRKAGADIVVKDLRELDQLSSSHSAESKSEPEHALKHVQKIVERLKERRLALFFDYDGTLTPIVRRPEEATLSDEMRSLLRELASRVTVSIVSGRDLADVRKMVGLDRLYYAGSHGFDVAGPDNMQMQLEQARDHLAELDEAAAELKDRLELVKGAWVERKRFAIAVHYREADERDAGRIEQAVDRARAAHPGLRKKGGKKIFELQPDVPWDKGKAVRWLLEQLKLAGPDVLPVYVGDDVTDEDAFKVLSNGGLGIRVGLPDEPTSADFYLQDTGELERFARQLLARLEKQAKDHG